MFQKPVQYKNTEDGACIISCLLKNDICTNHSTVFIYNSIKLINLINGLRRSTDRSNEGGSIIKSNTTDEEFVNKARLFSVIHTSMCIPKCQGTPALLGDIKCPSKDAGGASMAFTETGCSALLRYLAVGRILYAKRNQAKDA